MLANIGVLALQGAFAAHEAALAALGLRSRPVRAASDLADLHGLILPGGESSTQLALIARHGLEAPLRAFVASGAPVLATCAGLILAAATVDHPAQASFGFLDVSVERNAWGRQLDSFEALADDGVTPLVFIRAPRLRRVGAGVQVLLTYAGEPVLVQQRNVVAATFHPELTADPSIHRRLFAPS